MMRASLAWGAVSLGGAVGACCGPTRMAMAGGVILSYAAMCMAVRATHRRTRAPGDGSQTQASMLVAYASQTGRAEELAAQSAATLRHAGLAVDLEPLEAIDAARLSGYERALFIVSTTGEGDAPDHVARFPGRAIASDAATPPPPMPHYAMLALGDRRYAGFCAFGHRVEDWLRGQGAKPLFESIEVDDNDAGALHRWSTQVSSLAGNLAQPDLASHRSSFSPWTLDARTLLNPGSVGGPAYHVCLTPMNADALDWQAGDIAQIRPQHAAGAVSAWLRRLQLDAHAPIRCDGALTTLQAALASRVLPADVDALRGFAPQELVDTLKPLATRDYSISSLPADGRIELLVRQARHADADAYDGVSLGIASGWLTRHATPGASVEVRVRSNRAFHAPDDERPLVLIGAGTGLAGLRAHLKSRIERGCGANWLIFGERNQSQDAFHADELARWQDLGMLQRLDLVWSRDGAQQRHVHEAMRIHAALLREWVLADAAIYVCGSAARMGRSVETALAEILGRAELDALRVAGRYRRDIY
ncbi:sulfite reductase flavoprotein subunit alpha [Caballeronia sp. LZ035]|uniref:sulfite reductase subunit alpha n=1 Tax=Caballeronia sp. LZ035 TaxID=3038568 RepID=UPI00286D61E6|nr:sulfite reductase flavoprotein subunit alpha [Caballeronia sp. LZ035]